MNTLRYATIPAALALIVAAGYVNGILVDRWAPSAELAHLDKAIPAIPLTIGPWTGQDTTDPELLKELQRNGTLATMISRVYTNASTGEAISLTVATGKPGPISTHNPRTCVGTGIYRERRNSIKPISIKLPNSETPVRFNSAIFDPSLSSSGTEPVRYLVWSWRSRNGWVDSNDARRDFAGYPALTKIYIGRADNFGAGFQEQSDPIADFIRDALPVIDATLATPETTKTPAA
jgi:hypothetical protein